MSTLLDVIEEIIKKMPNLYPTGGSGTRLNFPCFDLKPQDYLTFAEQYLGKNSPEDKINCVSHLKRAMECEVDTFIHILGLAEIVNKRNCNRSDPLSGTRRPGRHGVGRMRK